VAQRLIIHYPAMALDQPAVLYGAASQDIGKIIHLDELTGPGSQHEAAGEACNSPTACPHNWPASPAPTPAGTVREPPSTEPPPADRESVDHVLELGRLRRKRPTRMDHFSHQEEVDTAGAREPRSDARPRPR
jgi:hypothetical protein